MRRRLVALALVLSTGCGASPSTDVDSGAPPADSGPPAPFEGEHTLPSVDVAVGADIQGICQSWALENEQEIWVHEVEMTAGPGWHHSNWMWVPEAAFPGPDGTWRCREREFDELQATIVGGNVFFAQSTQATHELQTFPPGAAYRIPPHSRVIGSIHLINFTGEPLATDLTFRIGAIPASEVTTTLHPLAIDNRGIELAPRSTTQVVTGCDLRRANGGALDFSVFYVLPHYHGLADGLRVELMGGARDGEPLFETTGGIGNALGGPLDPPFDVTGADGLRVRCTYQNDGPDVVQYGASADDEMCTILAYTDAETTFGGIATSLGSTETMPDGTVLETSSCLVVGY